jgi:hypothetical protein
VVPTAAKHVRRSASVMKNEAGDTKDQWIQLHAQRLLQHWFRRQSPFSIAPEYVRQLERDLAEFYEQPLMKMFIENTY